MRALVWMVLAIALAGVLMLMIGGDGVAGVSGDRIGRGFYIAAFGAIAAVGILGSGMRFGAVLRSLAAWTLVILALVAVYQYRYELQDFASRVTAGLVPGSPLSLTDSSGNHRVELDKLPDGHFGVRANVDGSPVDFVVDTGATTTVLTFQDAQRAGIDMQGLSFTVPVSTANGGALTARAVASEIAIGSIKRRNVPILVAEDHALGQSLLGMNFLGTLSGYDVRGDRMILRD